MQMPKPLGSSIRDVLCEAPRIIPKETKAAIMTELNEHDSFMARGKERRRSLSDSIGIDEAL